MLVLHQTADNEWSFNLFDLEVHVKGQEEKDYVEKHYDVIKEYFERMLKTNEDHITEHVNKFHADIQLPGHKTARFSFDRVAMKRQDRLRPEILVYVLSVTDFTFLFITSKLVGNYKKNLIELSINTGVNGGAIGVDNLLYLSDKLKGNDIGYNDFFNLMQNDEITIAV